MGKHDRDRLAAINAGLAEMHAMEEEIAEAMVSAMTEQSRMLEEEYWFNRRVNAIYGQIKRLGVTPNEWVAEQPATTETSMLHQALAHKWEADTGRADTSFRLHRSYFAATLPKQAFL